MGWGGGGGGGGVRERERIDIVCKNTPIGRGRESGSVSGQLVFTMYEW